MSTKITGADIQRKSFYKVLSHEIDCALYHTEYGELSIYELKEAVTDTVQLFETVRDHLSENEEISQALAHLKVTARQETGFSKDGLTWYTREDLLYFDYMLMEALGFTEREKLIILYEEIKGYGRYVHSELFKMNENKEEEIQLLKETV